MTVRRRVLAPKRSSHGLFRFTTARIPFKWVLLAHILVFLGRHWRFIAVFTAFYVFWRVIGPFWGIVGLGLLAFTALAWFTLWKASFERRVLPRVWSRWRWLTVYRAEWQPAMVFSGLSQTAKGREYLPRLISVRSRRGNDVLRVRMGSGQLYEDWTKASQRLAQAFELRDIRVRPVPLRPKLLDLHCLSTEDPLTELVPVPEPNPRDLSAIEVGRREDGKPYYLRLLYNHLLIGGATGSGKGGCLRSLILGLAPAVRDGLVKIYSIDPKSMELELGRPLFAKFVKGAVGEQVATMLEGAVEAMNNRADRLSAVKIRKLIPGDPEQEKKLGRREPLIVIIIDELAALTAFVGDRKVRERIENALGLLLTQGRAVGVSVVAALQDVRKDTLSFRDLFSVRVCLRTNEAEQVDMTLGRGARERGAHADKIAPSMPGVAYVLLENHPDPQRVRFSWPDDQLIEKVVDEFSRELTAA